MNHGMNVVITYISTSTSVVLIVMFFCWCRTSAPVVKSLTTLGPWVGRFMSLLVEQELTYRGSAK